MKIWKICDGYEDSGVPETNCASKLIAVIGPGGECYCQEHENMAGSVVKRFDPPRQLPDEPDED